MSDAVETETREILRAVGTFLGDDGGWEKWRVGGQVVRCPGENNGCRRSGTWLRVRSSVRRAARAAGLLREDEAMVVAEDRPARTRSFRSKTFRREFDDLQPEVRRAAVKYFQAFRSDEWHRGLVRQAIKINRPNQSSAGGRSPRFWQVWIGDGHRAVVREGGLDGDEAVFVWEWIGTKERYDSVYGAGLGPTSRPHPPACERAERAACLTTRRKERRKLTRREKIEERIALARRRASMEQDAGAPERDEMPLVKAQPMEINARKDMTTTISLNQASERAGHIVSAGGAGPPDPGAAHEDMAARLANEASDIRARAKLSSDLFDEAALHLEQAAADRRRLEIDLDEGRALLAKESAAKADSEAKLARLEAEIAEAERAAKEQVAAARRTFDAELSATARRYQGEIQKALEEASAARAELEGAKRRAEQYRVTLETQQKAAAEQLERERRARAEAEERLRSAPAATVPPDTGDAARLRSELDAALARASQAEAALDARDGAVASANDERDRLASEKAGLSEALAAAQAEVARLRSEAGRPADDGPFAPKWAPGGKCYILSGFEPSMLPFDRMRYQAGLLPNEVVVEVLKKAKAEGTLQSGIRDDDLAKLLTRALGHKLDSNRSRFSLEPGDVALMLSYEGPPLKSVDAMTPQQIRGWSTLVRWYAVQVEG